MTNKLGDLNWKIAHRVLPTALSLYWMGVYGTPNCQRCGEVENIEHVLTASASTHQFWNQVQIYMDRITSSRLNINNHMKLLRWIPSDQVHMSGKAIHLVNWVLCVAHYAIHKSAVTFSTRNETTPIALIFQVFVKNHLRF